MSLCEQLGKVCKEGWKNVKCLGETLAAPQVMSWNIFDGYWVEAVQLIVTLEQSQIRIGPYFP